MNFDAANPANFEIDATIGATAISTREEPRNAHLKSAVFFRFGIKP